MTPRCIGCITQPRSDLRGGRPRAAGRVGLRTEATDPQRLNAPGVRADDVGTLRQQVARDHGLVIVEGTIQIPDLRLEYETPSGEAARVDLELATEHYKPSQLAAKARAGFTLYAPPRRRAASRPRWTSVTSSWRFCRCDL